MANIKTVVVGDISTNCYLLYGFDKTAAIIDPGDQADKIIKALEAEGLTPKYILLTHGHHDHIGAIKPLRAHYPNIKVGIGREDAEMICNPEINYAKYRRNSADLFDNLHEDFTFSDGDVIELDDLKIAVIECPGHSAGGVCFICEGEMFTGDSLFAGDIGRTDLHRGSYETLVQSVTRIMLLEGEYNVYPGHGPKSTMAHERKHNNYVRV